VESGELDEERHEARIEAN